MNLLLHIGTHKTATTSLQHFFALNRALLRSYGFYYPENDDSAYAFNFLASRVAFGKSSEAAAFLASAREKAKDSGCQSVLISGESFYAMTGFSSTCKNVSAAGSTGTTRSDWFRRSGGLRGL